VSLLHLTMSIEPGIRNRHDSTTCNQVAETRVLFLFGTEPDGTLVRKISALQRCGHDVHLLYLHRLNSPISYPFLCPTDSEHTHQLDVPDPRRSSLVRVRVMLGLVGRYVALLRQIRPTVVHAVGFDMYFLAWLVRFVFGPTYLIYDLIDTSEQLETKWISRLQRLTVPHAAAVLTTSQQFFSDYLDRHHVRIASEKRIVLPNAPAAGQFASFRRKSHGPLTVGYIGTIRCREALHQLFAAVQQLRDRGKDIRLFFAGAGVDAQYVVDRAKALPWVTCVGPYNYDEDIATLYAQVDVVFAMYDASKNKKIALACRLSEAIVCGLPVLVNSDTYMGEIVSAYGLGHVVPVGDTDALAEAIAGYLDPNLVEAVRQRASAIRHEHLFETHVEKLLSAYARLACAQ
jgi:glycosyltransferase involved in cell wall biosynthesis